jgi:hypothetical protein
MSAYPASSILNALLQCGQMISFMGSSLRDGNPLKSSERAALRGGTIQMPTCFNALCPLLFVQMHC